ATVLLTTENAAALERNLCLEVPRGGEFKIQLEDGTEVWLNSSSRLYYPKTFSGDVRKVRIEGEAYLAVATDSLRPFYVETDNQQIRVYGTEFNVRYYPDETEVYTTLERGKVSLSRLDEPDAELFLTPGHQAVFRTADQRVRVRPVNTDVVTSWRKGRFVFEHQTLMRIMQDLSRWYDFEYEFTDDSLRGEEFMGSIPRYSDFTTAIAILEKCGGIKFSVSDGKVIVSRSGQ
ncbi:MAG: FecR domain-containing protein, partial [Duncaniella sp.]|nr:FecR domain-containing protein [Duncaniella sp.]